MKKAKKKHTHLHFFLFIFNTTFLITFSKRKRKERKVGKGEDRKTKGNVKTAVGTLFNSKFAFCACAICRSWHLLDLWIVFWVILAFNSQTMTGSFFFVGGRGGGWGAKLSGANYGVFIRPQVLFLPWGWNLQLLIQAVYWLSLSCSGFFFCLYDNWPLIPHLKGTFLWYSRCKSKRMMSISIIYSQ